MRKEKSFCYVVVVVLLFFHLTARAQELNRVCRGSWPKQQDNITLRGKHEVKLRMLITTSFADRVVSYKILSLRAE